MVFYESMEAHHHATHFHVAAMEGSEVTGCGYSLYLLLSRCEDCREHLAAMKEEFPPR
jgi:hypothetical protein